MLTPAGDGVGNFRRLHLADPGVALLASVKIPGGVAVVVGGSAVFKIMVVIRAEMGVDPVVAQNLGHGIVKGFDRPPTAVQKIVAPGMQFPARGHTGHTAHVAVVKSDSALGQTGKVGSVDPVAAVGG